MFGLGMVVHFGLSILLEKVFFKKFALKKDAKSEGIAEVTQNPPIDE